MTQTKEEILTETYDAWHKEMSDKHITFPLTVIREAFERVEQATIMRCIEVLPEKYPPEDINYEENNSEAGYNNAIAQAEHSLKALLQDKK